MQREMRPPQRANNRRQRRFTAKPYALLLGVVAALGVSALAATPALAATETVNGSFSVPAGASPGNVAVWLVNKYGQRLVQAVDTPTGATTATYQFTGVAAGLYYVYFTDSTTADNVQNDYYGDGGADNIGSATLENFTAGGTATLNSVALTNGAIITGTVSDANKAGESAATVYAFPVFSGNDPDPALAGGGAVTVSNGTYTIAGLAPGTYALDYYADGTGGAWRLTQTYVSSTGLSYNYANATQYAVAAKSTTTVNIPVPALSTISGTVSSAAGPVGDDEVQAWDGFGDVPGYAVTAGDGTYSMMLLPGTYKVSFGGFSVPNLAATWYGGPSQALASPVTVAAGASAANINATLGAGGTITGTVVSAQGGAPLGNVEVDLVDSQGMDVGTYAYTQPNGTYTLTDVPAGTWYVRFDAGQAYSGGYYAQSYYGGTQTEFGASAVTVAAGQTVSSVNGVMLPFGTAALGVPTESAPALSGLHNNKVALKFNVAAGTGAGYLKTLTIGLPKGFSWNASKLATALSLGSGVTFTDTITNGSLVITLTNGAPSVALAVAPGGIKVTKAIEKAAGGLTKKPKKHHKKKHILASAAKKKKPTKPKDTIKSEQINLTVSDTTGITTSLPITINHPH